MMHLNIAQKTLLESWDNIFFFPTEADDEIDVVDNDAVGSVLH